MVNASEENSSTAPQTMAHPTNDELNLNELQDAAAGIIEPNYSPAPLAASGGLRLIQSWGPELQNAADGRYPNPQK